MSYSTLYPTVVNQRNVSLKSSDSLCNNAGWQRDRRVLCVVEVRGPHQPQVLRHLGRRGAQEHRGAQDQHVRASAAQGARLQVQVANAASM